jgi:hypothetical protein
MGVLVDLGNVILKLIWQKKCPEITKNNVKNNKEIEVIKIMAIPTDFTEDRRDQCC